MIFVLGCLVAGLLSLLAMPAYRRRAQRLADRRLALTMPLSMDEVIAERDQIRAENAVALRRMEQKAEALLEARAADMTELGRRAARIVELEAELGANSGAATQLREELATMRREREEAWAERAVLDKALFDSDSRAEREHELRRDVERRDIALHVTADERHAEIAALQARLLASQTNVEAREAALHEARVRQAALEAEIAAARQADAEAREDIAVLRKAIADLGDRLLKLDAPQRIEAAQ